MSERHQVAGTDIRPSTIPEAIDALSSGQVKRFILLAEQTTSNTHEGGESVVVLTNPSLPHELVLQLMETFLQRPPGSLEDNSLKNN